MVRNVNPCYNPCDHPGSREDSRTVRPGRLTVHSEKEKAMTNRELILKFYEEVFNGKDLSRLDDYMLD